MRTFSYIEEKTEDILKESNLLKPNFDVKKLASQLKIKLIEKTMSDEVSGFFVMTEGLPVITYNKLHKPKRQRFTIAHEIGHFILHSKEQPISIDKVPKVMFRNSASSSGEILKEREANSFAASLLMPKALIEHDIEHLSPIFIEDAISKMANDFGVSEQAMSFRLSNLGYGI